MVVRGWFVQKANERTEREREREGCQDWLFELYIVHLLSGKTRNVVVVGEWVEGGIMHALVCLQGKWSLIMQLSLTFAIFDHPHLW
jgi:hypothetical protein